MEALRNYLETMFAKMPNTPEVNRAKDELWQMMEDKYNELIAEGKSENYAVGTVISEFGSLEEIADDLGISSEYESEKEAIANNDLRKISLSEIKGFLRSYGARAFLIAFGVFFCIFSLTLPQTGSALDDMLPTGGLLSTILGFGMLFFLALGAVLFVIAGAVTSKWRYIRKGNVYIDYENMNYILKEKDTLHVINALVKALGILLCVFSIIPAAVLEEVSYFAGPMDLSGFGIVAMFTVLATGVFLIVLSSLLNRRYKILLGANDASTISGNYSRQSVRIAYKNSTVEALMSIYWPIVTCIYLIVSFLTFKWYLTWLIWIAAWAIHKILEATLGTRVSENA